MVQGKLRYALQKVSLKWEAERKKRREVGKNWALNKKIEKK